MREGLQWRAALAPPTGPDTGPDTLPLAPAPDPSPGWCCRRMAWGAECLSRGKGPTRGGPVVKHWPSTFPDAHGGAAR